MITKCNAFKKVLIEYSIILFYFLHPCANAQGCTDLLTALRKGTDQPVKVIGRLLSLIKGDSNPNDKYVLPERAL